MTPRTSFPGVQVGDIVLFSRQRRDWRDDLSPGYRISKQIQEATGSPWNHAGLVTRTHLSSGFRCNGSPWSRIQVEVVEAVHKVRSFWLQGTNKHDIIFCRPRDPWTPTMAERAADFASRQIGEDYDYLHIGSFRLHLWSNALGERTDAFAWRLRLLMGAVRLFRKHMTHGKVDLSRWICSELVDAAAFSAGRDITPNASGWVAPCELAPSRGETWLVAQYIANSGRYKWRTRPQDGFRIEPMGGAA